jgi:hypothetical protein
VNPTLRAARPAVPIALAYDPVLTTPEYAAALAHVAHLPRAQAMTRAASEARRQLAPGVRAVILWTLLTGPFGVISATRRSAAAADVGMPVSPYWTALTGTLGVQLIILLLTR